MSDVHAPTPPIAVVPQPAEMDVGAGRFLVTGETLIVVEGDDAELRAIGAYLAEQLRAMHALDLKLADQGATGAAGAILLTTADGDPALGEEGYALQVTPRGATIRAPKPCGVFRGVQTLRQLIPLQAHVAGGRSGATTAAYDVPVVSIVDQPRYRWRGMLLDCCRHFMTKEFVKRYIDLLAYHKMNVLHWHLTEDQGWRIEIKKYPKLTEVGAWRDENGARYGGYYSQDDVREIVAYAKSRYVTVVPEIEMPGHSRAALASYPEYSCSGGPFEVANRSGIFEDVFCAGNDATFAFLEDVLGEVLELFPSEFIHVGGDECPKTRWKECPKCQARIKAEGLADEHELQSYFIQRIERFLNRNGRRLIGWDEILEGGLAPNATVQSWRGMEGAVAAAKAGHDVVASPTSHCYLDYPHEVNPAMPRWMRITSLETAYSFEATPAELSPEEAGHVLGGEGNIWTERCPQERVDHQVFPRLCAIGEALWTPAARREWTDFAARMEVHYRRLDKMGVNYYLPMPKCDTAATVFTDAVEVRLVNPFGRGDVHYTLDGTEPTSKTSRYTAPVRLSRSATVKARTILPHGNASDVAEFSFLEQDPRDAESPGALEPGLHYAYYEGRWGSLPDFAALRPDAEGSTPAFDLSMRRRDEDFGVVFTGYLEVPADGVYAFFVNSDDGATLFIGDREVLGFKGLQGPTELRGQIILRAGKHPLRVEYFQARGAYKFVVDYEGPTLPRQPVPASALWHPK